MLIYFVSKRYAESPYLDEVEFYLQLATAEAACEANNASDLEAWQKRRQKSYDRWVEQKACYDLCRAAGYATMASWPNLTKEFYEPNPWNAPYIVDSIEVVEE